MDAVKADLAVVLTMRNLVLEEQLLQLKRELFRRDLVERYGADVTGIEADGTIVRATEAATGGG